MREKMKNEELSIQELADYCEKAHNKTEVKDSLLCSFLVEE
jgi:hypothetical protein